MIQEGTAADDCQTLRALGVDLLCHYAVLEPHHEGNQREAKPEPGEKNKGKRQAGILQRGQVKIDTSLFICTHTVIRLRDSGASLGLPELELRAQFGVELL